MLKTRTLLISVLLVLAGCSMLGMEQELTPLEETASKLLEDSTSVPVEKQSKPQKQNNNPVDEVQLTWKVPEESVDGYLIHYGYSEKEFTKTIRLKVGELQTVSDPSYGKVYKYILSNVPVHKTIYITISAIKDKITSSPSSVIKLQPQK